MFPVIPDALNQPIARLSLVAAHSRTRSP